MILLFFNVGLRTVPFRRLQRAADRTGAGSDPPADVDSEIERCRRLVGTAAANHLPGTACLARSLALGVVLGRRGIGTRMRIGVQREGEVLAAHAWLEHEGRAIGEPEDVDRRYLPLVAGDSER